MPILKKRREKLQKNKTKRNTTQHENKKNTRKKTPVASIVVAFQLLCLSPLACGQHSNSSVFFHTARAGKEKRCEIIVHTRTLTHTQAHAASVPSVAPSRLFRRLAPHHFLTRRLLHYCC